MNSTDSQRSGNADATSTRGVGIDWAAVHRRMQQVKAMMDAAGGIAADKTAILKARARALAREPQAAQRTGHAIEVLEFMIAYERYALDSTYVREVHPLKDITQLPGTPAFVAGIVNVRGQIVSVIDLKQFFDLPRTGLTDLNRVIILNDGRMEFGLLVDAVIAVQPLGLDEIQPPPPTLTGVRIEYLHGVTTQRTIVLNAAKMLADPKIICEQ
jgi:purine-binding chemotaxis protein CheW